MFIGKLDHLLGSLAARPWWKRLFDNLRLRLFTMPVSSFAGVAFAACVALAVLSYWHWKLPTVSASELLARAVTSESNRPKVSDGRVVRQRIRIKTARKTVDRFVYRDVSGPLHPKGAGAGTEESELADHLALAGVNWDDPLSATSFKNWHDRQSDSIDEVRPGGQGLLTIRTRLADAPVVEESLTVTDDTFLSVQRSIEYRDIGDVQITDGGREPLSSKAAEQLFPKNAPSELVERKDFSLHVLLPSKAQLDETELKVRLTLSQQSADTGEQIEIERNAKAVLLVGVLDSEKRERQLRESLAGIPFLKVTMKNFEEYKSAPLPTLGHEVAGESAVAKISPLERFFVEQGRNRDDLSRISAAMFKSSLDINRSSRLIEALLQRFCNTGELTRVAIESRDALLARSTSRLLTALSEEQRLQREAGIPFEPATIAQANLNASTAQLAAHAERNLILVTALISGDSGSSDRTIQSITTELVGTTELLRYAALNVGSACRAKDAAEQ